MDGWIDSVDGLIGWIDSVDGLIGWMDGDGWLD